MSIHIYICLYLITNLFSKREHSFSRNGTKYKLKSEGEDQQPE